MNTTFGNTAVNTWKRIKFQHISAVVGLAIAASAALALSWQGSAATLTSPTRAAVTTSQSDETQGLVLFIAGSQQQASDHAASIRQDLDPRWFGSFSFVVVTNAEEEAALRETQREQALAGSSFAAVVDLRTR